MNRLEVGEVVIGTVRGIKPYGAFIDIGGVSGLLHISEISHDHIDTPSSVFKVNDELKVMIIDLDSDRGRISLSTKQLEPEPGAMVKNPDLVYDKAEEMAAKFREKMMAEQRGETAPQETVVEEEVAEAASEPEVEEAQASVASASPEETIEPVTEEAAPEIVSEAATSAEAGDSQSPQEEETSPITEEQ